MAASSGLAACRFVSSPISMSGDRWGVARATVASASFTAPGFRASTARIVARSRCISAAMRALTLEPSVSARSFSRSSSSPNLSEEPTASSSESMTASSSSTASPLRQKASTRSQSAPSDPRRSRSTSA